VPEVADHPGAPWQVLPYERQLEVKAEQVDEALRRIGRLDGFELEPIVAAEQPWRYRNKLEYSFGTGEDGELVCGFHAPGRWNDIVPMTDCKLASERSNELREQVLAFCRERGLRAWDRRAHRGFLRNLVVREGRRTGQTQVRLITSPGTLDVDALIAAVEADGLWWTQTEDLGESTYGGETTLLSGAPQLAERLGGLDFLISPEAFFQTNTEMAERLYGIALEYAALRGHERVFDLYSGIGTIALSMATRAREVTGLEIVEPAVADAIENARINEIQNASFYAGDIRLAMRELVERQGRPDVAVIDPPRAGLSRKVVRRIVRTRRSSSRRATGSSRCARSTCSRRRRTSSALRCWRPVATGFRTLRRTKPRRTAARCARSRCAGRPASVGAPRPPWSRSSRAAAPPAPSGPSRRGASSPSGQVARRPSRDPRVRVWACDPG
jgi:23S rRNA (uracil1939-C5)-methyltransferase